ncbi:mutator type transposase [Tanacetum coccineum]|uniref:Mutator type transposase n=1 Tax=Tanacetum coccineum TaxID=301880 RepID=A0ABQ4Z690_9ASTR
MIGECLEVRYYHYLKPDTKQDYGLVALGSDQDVKELLKYVVRNKVIDLYIEHDSTTLDIYFNGPRDRALIDDNMPPSPSDSKGITKLFLQTPPSSKPLTICQAIQLKYEERVRKGRIHIKIPFNPRPCVIYLGNLPLLKSGEIPWVAKEDYGEDIGCYSSKGKETKIEAGGSSKGKELEVESSSNETYYFDPFEDLDDILGQYVNDNRVKVESHRKSILDEQNMIKDVVIDMQPFKDDMDRKEALVRRCDLIESRIDRFYSRELVKDRIRKHSVESMRKLEITKNDNKRAKDRCVGTMPTYSSSDPHVDFSQASVGGALKKRFKASGKDIIGLDGCFMKGPYPCQILSVVGVDANNGIHLVAYDVVEAKTKRSWCWFLKLLGLDLDIAESSNFTFISDRHKELLWKPATATTIIEFDKNQLFKCISPTRYYKDNPCWSVDLKSKTTEDITSIGSFVKALVLNLYVLVRKILIMAILWFESPRPPDHRFFSSYITPLIPPIHKTQVGRPRNKRRKCAFEAVKDGGSVDEAFEKHSDEIHGTLARFGEETL